MIKVRSFTQRFYVKDVKKIRFWQKMESIEKSRAFLENRQPNITIKEVKE